MEIDYASRTYDFLVNGTAVNTEPIPFYTASANEFTQLRIFRGAGQAGILLDDLSISGGEAPGGGPVLSVREEGDVLVVAWPETQGNFVLQATDELVPADWSPVAHTTVGGENRATIQTTGRSRFFRLVQQ